MQKNNKFKPAHKIFNPSLVTPQGFLPRSSSRSVVVRDIAGRNFSTINGCNKNNLYPAQKPCGVTLVWKHCGMTNAARGFTLIELLVVVLIIGVLAAVALPQYQKAVLKSRYNTLKSLAKSIANAQEVFYLANNTYASAFDQLDVDMPAGKLNNSTASQYIYNWGYCYIIIDYGYQSIACKNTLADMGYQIRLQHAQKNPGDIKCIAYTEDLTAPQNQICKEETNATTNPTCCAGYSAEWSYK